MTGDCFEICCNKFSTAVWRELKSLLCLELPPQRGWRSCQQVALLLHKNLSACSKWGFGRGPSSMGCQDRLVGWLHSPGTLRLKRGLPDAYAAAHLSPPRSSVGAGLMGAREDAPGSGSAPQEGGFATCAQESGRDWWACRVRGFGVDPTLQTDSHFIASGGGWGFPRMPFVFFERKETGHSGKFPLVVKEGGGRLGKTLLICLLDVKDCDCRGGVGLMDNSEGGSPFQGGGQPSPELDWRRRKTQERHFL